MNLSVWRQVGEVLARTVPTAALDRVRSVTDSTPRATVGWRIVNLDIDGRNFRYRVTDNDDAYGPDGVGTPPIWAINLHGYFAGGSMYARESELLAERFGWRVVNPSLPAFGGSDPLELVDISLEALTDHVEIVRRELGITKCVVIGHSMGGAVAIRVVLERPDLVRSLILMDTSGWSFRPLDEGVAAMMSAFMAAFDPAGGLPDLSAMAGPEDALITDATSPEWQAIKAEMAAAFDPYAMKALGNDLFNSDLSWVRARLAEVTCPVTVIVGEHDHPFIDQAEELAGSVADGRLTVIPGAYHSPQLTHQAEWTAAVEAHLARVS